MFEYYFEVVVNATLLHQEIEDTTLPVLLSVSETATGCVIAFVEELDAGELTILTNLVNDHDTNPLARLKVILVDQIDVEAHRRMEENPGFAWPEGAEDLFSHAYIAQTKWHGLYCDRANLSYPVSIRTKDETSAYSLADADAVIAMYQALIVEVTSLEDEANVAKGNVMAAENVEDAQAAADAYLEG